MAGEDETLGVQLLSPDARPPWRASEGAAGFDLYAAEAATVPPGGRRLVSTGLALRVPRGTYGRIAPRSGLALRGIAVGAGVVDRDYRGVVQVLLFNLSDEELAVRTGDRVAQLILERCASEGVRVEVVAELDDTARGTGGFGSTGAGLYNQV